MRRVDARVALAAALVASTLLTGCMDAGDGEPVPTNRVTIPGAWVFEPAAIEVANGTEVTWTNNGGQAHTITFAALDIDEVIEPGGTVRLTFDEPGRYPYTCRYHPPDMTGTVVVLEATNVTA